MLDLTRNKLFFGEEDRAVRSEAEAGRPAEADKNQTSPGTMADTAWLPAPVSFSLSNVHDPQTSKPSLFTNESIGA